MDTYINATSLIKTLEMSKKEITRKTPNQFQKVMCNYSLDSAIKYIEAAEASGGEFRKIVRAHWVFCAGSYKCSNCGVRSYDKEDGEYSNDRNVRFCPYCGALMDLETEE